MFRQAQQAGMGDIGVRSLSLVVELVETWERIKIKIIAINKFSFLMRIR